MTSLEQSKEGVVFGLDIGTRTVVGTVGYEKAGKFHVIAQKVEAHQTRAMLDGQIHDIGKVSQTIRAVKESLEQETDIHLTDVCIAAAGRVLKTIQVTYEEEYAGGDHEMTDEDIYNLESKAVEKAYGDFLKENTTDLKYYLVGYSTVHYYLNGYQIANLEGHKAQKVAVDLIATFLPDDVVDGLYKACERAGLQVANLTLEPIAAIMVAIPERFRMLNLALIDVGAGTSDICITDDGSITAYGMLPVAGDALTEVIAQHCLVDFNTADEIKISASKKNKVEYMDIMGLKKTITSKEIAKLTEPLLDKMADQVTEEIKRLNGDKPVSAVFIVGGGGRSPEYAKAIARDMGIAEERVALRGEEVMKDIVFLQEEKDGIARDSLMVTPLGICMSYYEECNNFIFVSFNGTQTKLYDNGHIQIVDAAMQVNYSNEDLFPKRGKELRFILNGEERIVRGQPGEAAVIRLNGQVADIHTKIHSNDIIEVTASTAGEPGSTQIAGLSEFKSTFNVNVNGQTVQASRFATVNGAAATAFYEVQEGDSVQVLDYDTVGQIAKLMDIEITPDTVIRVNNEEADENTPVYENFKVEFTSRQTGSDSYADLPDEDPEVLEAQRVAAEAEAQRKLQEHADAAAQAMEKMYSERGFGQSAQGNSASSVSYADQAGYAQQAGYAVSAGASRDANYSHDAMTAQDADFSQGAVYATELRQAPEQYTEESVLDAYKSYPTAEEVAQQQALAEENGTAGSEETSSFHVNMPKDIHIMVNDKPVTMRGKTEYIFVDIFDYIDFDLSTPNGRSIVTLLNGGTPDYMQKIDEGDRIEIYWKDGV